MARRSACALACVSALAAVGTADAVAGKVLAHGAKLTGTKVWYAHATARRPKRIAAWVDPVPAQRVKVQWSVVCQKPNRADPAIQLAPSEKAGQMSVGGKAALELALPYANPPTCVVTVYATLSRRGALTLELLET